MIFYENPFSVQYWCILMKVQCFKLWGTQIWEKFEEKAKTPKDAMREIVFGWEGCLLSILCSFEKSEKLSSSSR